MTTAQRCWLPRDVNEPIKDVSRLLPITIRLGRFKKPRDRRLKFKSRRHKFTSPSSSPIDMRKRRREFSSSESRVLFSRFENASRWWCRGLFAWAFLGNEISTTDDQKQHENIFIWHLNLVFLDVVARHRVAIVVARHQHLFLVDLATICMNIRQDLKAPGRYANFSSIRASSAKFNSITALNNSFASQVHGRTFAASLERSQSTRINESATVRYNVGWRWIRREQIPTPGTKWARARDVIAGERT